MLTRRILDSLTHSFAAIGCLALVLMMLQISLDVLAKYVLNFPIPVTIELASAYYMVAVVFLPLAMVERQNAHISVEIVTQHLPARARELLLAATSLLAALYFAALTYRTWGDAITKYEVGEFIMGTVSLPTWPSRFLLPAGCGLCTLLLVYKAWRLAIGDS